MKRLLLLSLFLLAGCASYEARHTRPQGFTGFRHLFVLSNANDNRALDRQIAAALRARGYEVETGPHTMMPDATQVVITYQDVWAWDFREHLVSLQLQARERKANTPFATARYGARFPSRKPVGELIDGLVEQLLTGKAR